MNLHRSSRNIRAALRALFAVMLFLGPLLSAASAQSGGNWSGQVQCRFDDVDQSYSRHEVQTWMLTGAAPTTQGSMYVYPATWSSTGQGALQRVQGTQTTNIQWTTNVPAQQATIAIFVRASDGRLIIKPWHSQMHLDYAVTGSKQIVANGVAQQPTSFVYPAWEWQFPRIEDLPTNTNVTGSSQSQADGGSAELVHRNGGIPLIATCQWQFTKGGMTPTNSNQMGANGGSSNQSPQGSMAGNNGYQGNSQNCESPAAVQQSFENMKGNLQTQYNQLIQGTSDPAQVASLTSQEQRMLSNLNAQEQHDAAAASQGCVQAANQGTTGGSSYGSGQYSGNTGNNQYSGQNGTSQYSSNNSNSGSSYSAGNQYPGNNQNSGNNQNQGNTQSSSNSNNNGMGSSTQNGAAVSSGQQPPAPQLLSVTPSSVSPSNTTQITLVGKGTHWQSQTTNVSFGSQVTVQSFTADPSGTSGIATITAASNASPGSRPVMLMSGTEMVGLPSGLTVTAAPSQPGSNTSVLSTSGGMKALDPATETIPTIAAQIAQVNPSVGQTLQTVSVTLTGKGTHFVDGQTNVAFLSPQAMNQARTKSVQTGSSDGTTASSGNNNAATSSVASHLQVNSVKVTSPTSAVATITIPASASGLYSIEAATPVRGNQSSELATLSNGFTVAQQTSGNYRVTMTGLMCAKAITGGGDAIYGAAVIRQYDRSSGQAKMFTNANSWVYGNTNGMIGQRIQAGTWGPMGGIGNGNFVPTGFSPGPRDTLPPQPNVFPLALWQGTLTNGVDALVISPSLWISYGDNSMFFNWNQNEDSLTNSIYLDSHVQNQINTQTFGPLFFGASQNVSGSAASSVAGATVVGATEELIQASGLTFGIPVGIFAITGPSHDRPIGVSEADKNNPTSNTVLPNATLVLTREIIEKVLGNNNWTTMTFNFQDDPFAFSSLPNTDRPGAYTMFIQIERQ